MLRSDERAASPAAESSYSQRPDDLVVHHSDVGLLWSGYPSIAGPLLFGTVGYKYHDNYVYHRNDEGMV